VTETYEIAETRVTALREEAVELAALSWFELLGWRTVPGDYLAPGGPSGARTDYRQAVLEPELRSALATLNPDAAPAMIDAATRSVLVVPSQDLLENNRAFHPLLASGVPVEIIEGGETRTIGLRLLDRANPRANRLLVANQFIVQGDRETIRADIAVFINGLPLGILELKSPTDAQATLERAYTQLQNYKAKAPELMRCSQVLVISDGIEARIGSLTAGLDRFGPWRTIDGEVLEDEGRPELEVLIRGVFAPERFLDLIVDYIAFEIEDGVVKSKKLAGYHQFHAVRKALASTLRAAGADGGRKGGVIWHTQGSGKSLTMLFFVRQLQLARELKNPTLPNATFIGFTGTPIELRGRNTAAVFGDVVDTYDMSQAVADNATVPIHYAARLVKLHLKLSADEREQMDALAEELAEGDETAIERSKGKLSRFDEVVGAPDRVAEIAADIVEHFGRRREAMAGGKGMIVAISRRVAVELYDHIAALRPDWVSVDPQDDAAGLLKVVITGNGNADPPPLQPHLRSKRRREAIAERFKNPASGFDLVIVRDMWLTGFDAPSLHTLYIDKPMRGHGLMQAIARVNRVWGDKPGGLVVDYLGIGGELREALAQYSARDREQVRLDQDEAVRQTLMRLESAEALLGNAAWRDFFGADPAGRLTVLKRCLEALLAAGRRDDFVKTAIELETAYALTAGDERVAPHHDEIALVAVLRANLIKYTSSGGRGRTAVEQELRQLLSRAVMADGILDVFKVAGLDQPDLSILSEQFLTEIRQTEERNLAVETLRRLLAGEIKARERANIVLSRKLSERLDDTLRRYHNRAVDSVQVIEELIALARDISADAARGTELGLNNEELAFYDALAENGSARELMAHEQLRLLAQMLVRAIHGSATIDWTKKESVRAKMRIEVRKLLARYGYPPDLQRAAVDLVIRQAESLGGWA
jgi:type I site-specific restriction-modification system R (restriction) subunit